METHFDSLEEPHFSNIPSPKTVEVRINSESKRRWLVGDVISFSNASNPDDTRRRTVRIVKKKYFASFEAMFTAVGLEKVLPGVTSIEDGIAIYREWYSAEREAGEGVVAFFLAPI